jgi:hypothetical protein
MAIRWFNIKSGAQVVAETEPQIAALLNSSDHSPNAYQGQDFGWRLAPAVHVEMKKIKQDYQELERIARRMSKPVEEVSESDILYHISSKTALENAPVADVSDYQDEYDAQVRALEQAGKKPVGFDGEEVVGPTTTQPTTTAAPTTTEAPTTTQPPETDSTTTTTTEMVE